MWNTILINPIEFVGEKWNPEEKLDGKKLRKKKVIGRGIGMNGWMNERERCECVNEGGGNIVIYTLQMEWIC